ncbi:MAG: MarR family transcriptional regulator [Lewinellaceae bacterium]|nr:MarR family transcriptional regulator [Lewinellaceae bacterium]
MNPDLEQAFSFWLDRTARIMKHYAASRAQALELGITIDQWMLLAMVFESPGISQDGLCERTLKDKASVARLSSILEKEQLITRVRKPDNAREYALHCTTKGKEKVKFLLPYVQKAREVGMEGLRDEEVQQLTVILQQVYRNYEKAMK